MRLFLLIYSIITFIIFLSFIKEHDELNKVFERYEDVDYWDYLRSAFGYLGAVVSGFMIPICIYLLVLDFI